MEARPLAGVVGVVGVGGMIVGFGSGTGGDRLMLICLFGDKGTFAGSGLVGTGVDLGDNGLYGTLIGALGGDAGAEPGGVRRVHEDDGTIVAGLSLGFADFGGHSRFSLISSLSESPVLCDMTLELRGEAEDVD